MKLVPGPMTDAPIINTTNSSPARERAIAKFNEVKAQAAAPQAEPAPTPTQASDIPVQNASAVQPEELSVVSPKERVQENKVESPTEATTEVQEAKEEPLSAHYAQLARKEKALRAKAQAQIAAINEREAALKAREEAVKAKEAEYTSNYIDKSRLKSDPWNTLQDVGVTYDELTQYALNQQQENPQTKAALSRLEAQIAEQKAANERLQASIREQEQNQYKQAVNQIRADAKSLVSSDPSFELIKETNSLNDVVELIEETFKKDGILLTVEEAAQEVENYLTEEVTKYARTKKIQQRLTPQSAPSKAVAAPKQPEAPKQQQSTKTLTNANSVPSRPMSARERAILAFKGQLRK